MNERLFQAYLAYTDDLGRRGILDHGLTNAVADGETVERHMIEVLRAAGRLPEGWDQQEPSDQPAPARQSA